LDGTEISHPRKLPSHPRFGTNCFNFTLSSGHLNKPSPVNYPRLRPVTIDFQTRTVKPKPVSIDQSNNTRQEEFVAWGVVVLVDLAIQNI
jgi:hypothetical protein